MKNFSRGLLLASAAASTLMSAGVAQAATAPVPTGLFEEAAGGSLTAAGVPLGTLTYTYATTGASAKPASTDLSVYAIDYGDDPTLGGYYIGAYNLVGGAVTVVPAVPAAGTSPAVPAYTSIATTENDAFLNSSGLVLSRLTGTTKCADTPTTPQGDLTDDTLASCVTDITTVAATSALTADSLTFTAGSSSASLSASGLNNGGHKITGVADGTAPTDAVNLRQLDAVKASLAGETEARIASDNLMRNQIASSTATAIALGGSVILPDTKFSLSGNVGFYKGAQAVAMTAAARLAPNVYLTGAVGGGLNKNGSAGGRVGFAIGW